MTEHAKQSLRRLQVDLLTTAAWRNKGKRKGVVGEKYRDEYGRRLLGMTRFEEHDKAVAWAANLALRQLSRIGAPILSGAWRPSADDLRTIADSVTMVIEARTPADVDAIEAKLGAMVRGTEEVGA